MSTAFQFSKFRTSDRINGSKLQEILLFGISCKMWPLAVVMGDPAFTVFFYKEMYGCFAGPKKSGRNNEVSVLPRWSAHQTNQSGWLKRSLHGSHSMLCYIAKVCVLFFSHAAGYRSPR